MTVGRVGHRCPPPGGILEHGLPDRGEQLPCGAVGHQAGVLQDPLPHHPPVLRAPPRGGGPSHRGGAHAHLPGTPKKPKTLKNLYLGEFRKPKKSYNRFGWRTLFWEVSEVRGVRRW